MDAHMGIIHLHFELQTMFYVYNVGMPDLDWEHSPWVEVGELFLIVIVDCGAGTVLLVPGEKRERRVSSR